MWLNRHFRRIEFICAKASCRVTWWPLKRKTQARRCEECIIQKLSLFWYKYHWKHVIIVVSMFLIIMHFVTFGWWTYKTPNSQCSVIVLVQCSPVSTIISYAKLTRWRSQPTQMSSMKKWCLMDYMGFQIFNLDDCWILQAETFVKRLNLM